MRKVIKTAWTAWRETYSSFLPFAVIHGVKNLYKKKNHRPENETCVCVANVCFCHISFE